MTTATRSASEQLSEALKTALSTLLHEDADPECTGSPPFDETEARAVSLAERVLRTPIVQNALEKPHIEAFVNGDVIEAGPDQYREVYYEPCPVRSSKKCESENHHYGRGDHLVPFDPDWTPA